MIDTLFYPELLLFVVLVAAVVALIADGKNTRLLRRVEALGCGPMGFTHLTLVSRLPWW